MLYRINVIELVVIFMNKCSSLSILLITLLLSSSQIFADGYIDKDVASSDFNLILDIEIDLLPGFKERQDLHMGAYLVDPNKAYTNSEIIKKNYSSSVHNSSLQELDEFEVARGNLLKVKFDHIWMVSK